MALQTAFAKDSVATHLATVATHGAVYTTTPGASAGTEVAPRKPLTWGAPVSGVQSAQAVFDIPADTTIVGTGLHTDLSGGDYVTGKTETSVTFTAADTLTVTFTLTSV